MSGTKRRMGRPLKFETVEVLQRKIDDYFAVTDKEEVTITGLAIHLDTSRETLMDYEEKDGFSDAVKKAKDRVQLEYELDLRRKGRSGDIFALKNFGWTDRQELDHTSDGERIGGFNYVMPVNNEETDSDDKPAA